MGTTKRCGRRTAFFEVQRWMQTATRRAGIILMTFQKPRMKASLKEFQNSRFLINPRSFRSRRIRRCRAVPAEEREDAGAGGVVLKEGDEYQRGNDEEVDFPVVAELVGLDLFRLHGKKGSGFGVQGSGERGRGQRAEVRREVRGQRAEVREGQEEVRGQRAEVRRAGSFSTVWKKFWDFPLWKNIFHGMEKLG